MRLMMIVGAALMATACDGAPGVSTDATPAAGYSLEIRASEIEQTYLVTAPDGRIVAARAAEGASALMDSSRARALAAETPPQGEEPPEVISLRVPGFEMQINASEEDAEGERGRVRMSIGDGSQRIEVDANEGGPGGADDRANVRITGADEEAVREFIAEADELSPSVQAEMLAELGLD